MNITKYVCKTFDREDKGYVTISDVCDKIMQIIADNLMLKVFIGIVIVFCVLLFNMIGELYYTVFDPIKSNPGAIIISMDKIFIGFIILGIILIIILTIYKIWEKIGEVKIVVCPLKNK